MGGLQRLIIRTAEKVKWLTDALTLATSQNKAVTDGLTGKRGVNNSNDRLMRVYSYP